MTKPLDHPTADRPHRLYFALTNHCNRACPWCSTCSSPAGSTYLAVDTFQARLPRDGAFQVQLEGGEPTVHPAFWDFVRIARAEPRCQRVVVCTNGVALPREPATLLAWLARLGAPTTIKLSLNHHLLARDKGLIPLALSMRKALESQGGDRLLVLNVRLRRGVEDDDRPVRKAVLDAGLAANANFFFLQRYGFAADKAAWDPPAPVSFNFTLVNPDGKVHGPDLLARTEGMRGLP
jgi:hypothetical protein